MPQQAGVLLVNLGSPASTNVSDVRSYLRQFLMDERVLDYPAPMRWLIVNGFILPSRPAKSAEAYQSVWMPQGSPLVVLSAEVQAGLQARLPDMPVVLAMRYGQPSIADGLHQLIEQGVNHILLAAMYPHYAMSTVETVVVEARKQLARIAPQVTMAVQPVFFDDTSYIDALIASARPYLEDVDHLLFSYHGVPERHLKKSDPSGAHCLSSENCCITSNPAHATCYRHQVFRTTQAFLERSGYPPVQTSMAFQSRLGRDVWLTPATDQEIERLARQGVRRLAVICPAFLVDCLETLEEIGMRGKEAFEAAGGEHFTLIPCLNSQTVWLDAYANLLLAALPAPVA